MSSIMEYYAHSPKRDIPAQYYMEHIQKVTRLAKEYAQAIGTYSKLDEEALLASTDAAGIWHDLGKLDKLNQSILSGQKITKRLPVEHWDAGAVFLKKHNQFAATAVYSHHIGYPDFVPESNRERRAFRVEKEIANTDKHLSEYVAIHRKLLGTAEDAMRDIIPMGDRSVFLRILLSCLVDADHSDTARHYGKNLVDNPSFELQPAKRLDKLNNYVANLAKKDKENDRLPLQNEMYASCRDSVQADTVGISSCDSPVGSGKTTAVMAHLLAQAQKRGLRRIFIVLPYTNIIQQSVRIYREALVLPGEKAEEVVAELHHRADFENEDARQYTALWRAPIIVTTAVAFFETIAAASPATLRRLHELPGSAIFVDEAHAALPVKLLPIAWKWMNIYADEWSCYWVLASGSLCRLWEIAEIAQDIKRNVPELVDESIRQRLSAYERGRIRFRSELNNKSIDSMVDWIHTLPGPRLVIVNTVNNAAVLAAAYKKRFGRETVEHISTALTPTDRDNTLERVKSRLKNKDDLDWVLIATSCMEAGVDLSFRNGFRELGSVVSLIQVSGRVNRKGKDDDAEVWSFTLADATEINRNPSMKDSAEVLRYYLLNNITVSQELCTDAISSEIRLHGVSTMYKKLLYAEENLEFATVEKEFNVIENDTRLVIVDSEIATRLKADSIDWQELQRNSVRIPEYMLKKYKTQEVLEGIYLWNYEYDDFLGYMAGILMVNDPENYIV